MSDVIIKDENTRLTMHDGATFITRVVPNSEAFTAAALIRAGSLQDGIPGTAHAFEHVPFRGTDHFGPYEVFAYMEERGGFISAYTGYDHIAFYGSVRKGHEADAIHAISDHACRPRLLDADIKLELETCLDESAHREMTPINYFSELAVKAYLGNAAPLPIVGTEETISKITPDDIRAYKAKNFVADELIVAMEGALEHDRMLEMAINRFQLPRGLKRDAFKPLTISPQTMIIPTEQRATKAFVIFPSASQTSSAQDFILGNIAEQLLTDISGPLLWHMRRRTPLVYGVTRDIRIAAEAFGFTALEFNGAPRKIPAAFAALAEGIYSFLTAPNEAALNRAKDKAVLDLTEHFNKNPEYSALDLALVAIGRGVIDRKNVAIDSYKEASVESVSRIANQNLGGDLSLIYIGQHHDDYPSHRDLIDLIDRPSAGHQRRSTSSQRRPS